MTSTTAPSTYELPAIIRALCPSGYADLADKLFKDLAHRQAVDDAKAARMRAARTAWIEAHIENVIRCTKKPALVDKPRCRWTGILMRYYETHGIDAPDIETVRRVVKEFNGF
jgi:hypothetical protein